MNLGAIVPQETAVLPLSCGTTAPFGGTAAQNEGERERGDQAVLPRRKGGTAALLPQRGTAQSDTEKDPSNRRGRDVVSQR